MKPAASIRVRAVVALSLVVTVLWLAAAGITSRMLTTEMGEVFDSALQETGQRILQLAVIDVLGREEEGITQQITALDAHEEYFTYLVRDNMGRVLLASHRADPAQFPNFTETGFHETDSYRYYQEAAVRGTIILTIAEPLAHRQSVSRELAMGLALPLLAVIPLSILGIGYGLGFGLRPLGQLRRQLAQRDANDLSPLPLDTLPAELQPIAGAVNQLFQRLQTAFDAERSFASNAAHELRTPLAGAVVQVQRLRLQTQEPETARRADAIEGTLKRLTRLSERLMQLARAEGAQLSAAMPHDLRVVLRLLVDDFSHGPDAGRIVYAAPGTPVLSEIDPDAAAIVLRNLIENALRHGADSPIRIALTAEGWLHVENDCAAVDKAMLAALSGRFTRGDGATYGSGLGLAIVRTVAERTNTTYTLASPIPGQMRGFRASIQLGTGKPSTGRRTATTPI
ncbi:ATP-binding protein [Pseudorhodobacter sp. W20_MBD10_FR17]|uniref:ATP-binding protein n=1 Tax=Pseudorhodobacter sp. W20_MBD10_FR17 TaxID=3240266 RepID=UPI003F9CEC87